MHATVLDDAMKDDALNDRVAGSVASLDKRKGSIELNIGHFERTTLGIGYVLLVYEEEDEEEELSVVQRSSCHLWLVWMLATSCLMYGSC